jgi:glycosyltransferase involved in cell wall biosynthesis
VRGSRGEVGIAKEGYVKSRSGWFSDRSACYLASGRPVVAQETGFSGYLPVGEGLFAFSSVDEAVAAIAEVRGDYGRHARAARALAEERLDSGAVLERLLDGVGGGSDPA